MTNVARVLIAIAGYPGEIVGRIMRVKWILPETVIYQDAATDRTLTALNGYPYDSFTYAPNLRRADGRRSVAAAIHDVGWERGTWDDGSILTFDENNAAFAAILAKEKHPAPIRRAYGRGVSAGFMRRKWIRKHGHA